MEASWSSQWCQRQIERLALRILDGILTTDAGHSDRRIQEASAIQIKDMHRLWKAVLLLARLRQSTCRKHLRESVYLRELFYQLVPLFANQREMVRTLDRLLHWLDCSRSRMGIIAESHGWVFFGPGVALRKTVASILPATRAPVAARHGLQHTYCRGMMPIPNDVDLDPFQYVLVREPDDSRAITILIVEKYGIFRNLIDEDLVSVLPSATILVTGCGQPSHATRAFVALLMRLLRPSLWCSPETRSTPLYSFLGAYVLTDYNPYGLCIARQYARCVPSFWKSTSATMDPSSVPRWIGPRACHLRQLPFVGACVAKDANGSGNTSTSTSRRPFSQRELTLARHLCVDAIRDGDFLVAEEIQEMVGSSLWSGLSTSAVATSHGWFHAAARSGHGGLGNWELQTLILCLGPGGFVREFLPRLVMQAWQKTRWRVRNTSLDHQT
jgi:DNA topoisomerase VI subunit A